MTKLSPLAAGSLAALLVSCGSGEDQPSTPKGSHQKEAAPIMALAAQPETALTLPARTSPTDEGGSCSGEMRAGDSGECAGACDQWDQAAGEVARRPIPTNAIWEEIPVEGMICGGCERRVIASVGQIEGVLAVEADAELGQVRVAMAPGSDLRRAAVARIISLGYRAR